MARWRDGELAIVVGPKLFWIFVISLEAGVSNETMHDDYFGTAGCLSGLSSLVIVGSCEVSRPAHTITIT